MRIHRIPVRGTNCYLLVDDDGTVLVDPGPARGATEVITGVQAAGVRPGDVRLILVTHGHWDHYGAVPQVKSWCGAPVAAYPGEPEFSRDRRNALPPAQTLRGSVVRWVYLLLAPLADFAPLEADLLLEDGASLAPYGVEAQTVFEVFDDVFVTGARTVRAPNVDGRPVVVIGNHDTVAVAAELFVFLEQHHLLAVFAGGVGPCLDRLAHDDVAPWTGPFGVGVLEEKFAHFESVFDRVPVRNPDKLALDRRRNRHR